MTTHVRRPIRQPIWRPIWRPISRLGLALATVAVAAWAFRRLSTQGASWSAAWRSILGVSGIWLLMLGGVWLLSQVVHTVALAASMPGLTRRRAFTLSLSSSAVTKALLFGAVAGTAVSLGMVRAWGHETLAFVRFIVVSKACDLVTKLSLPAVVALSGILSPGAAAMCFLASLVSAGFVAAGLAGRTAPLLRVVGWATLIRPVGRCPDPLLTERG